MSDGALKSMVKHFRVSEKTRHNVRAVSIGFAVALGLAELTLRVLGLGYGEGPYIPDPSLYHVHPANYTFTSHIPSNEYGGHLVYYDDQGLVADPASRTGEPSADTKYRVAFMGDSFTEARQVSWAKSFVGLLSVAGADSATVKNYGVSGYSPIFYAVQYGSKVEPFRPTLVVCFLYSNDIYDDETTAEIAQWSESGRPLAIPGPRDTRWRTLLRKSYLMRLVRRAQLTLTWESLALVEENPDISALSDHLMRILVDDVERSGSDFVLMVVPSKQGLDDRPSEPAGPQFSDKWKQWAEENRVSFIDLVGVFEEAAEYGPALFFEEDIHFTEEGHALVARAVKEHFPSLFAGEF